MKKNLFCLVIGLFVMFCASTVYAKIISVTINTTDNNAKVTHESGAPEDDYLKNRTTLWFIVNGIMHTPGAKSPKVRGTGVTTVNINYDIKIGDKLMIGSYDPHIKKCAYKTFIIRVEKQTVDF